jgi:hypothetical protein
MIPHVWIATTGALSKRLTQVSYINDDTNEWRAIYIFRQFVRHISNYLSPKNLFSDTRESFNPISPDLASFYSWFILPMVMGVRKITKKIPGELIKILSVLFVVSLIPAALTGDEFYPLRALEFLWVLSVVVGVGLYYILTFFKSTIARVILCFVIVIYTLSTLYVSFVVLFQYETTEYIGDTYIKLEEYLSKYGDKKIVIDSARDYAAGLRIAYFRAYNPNKLAAVLAPQMKSDYYSEDVNFDETYIIDNIEVRPIVFGEDTCLENGILVGDTLAINDEQAKEHLLTLEFEIAANNGQVVLKGYSTNPELKCK